MPFSQTIFGFPYEKAEVYSVLHSKFHLPKTTAIFFPFYQGAWVLRHREVSGKVKTESLIGSRADGATGGIGGCFILIEQSTGHFLHGMCHSQGLVRAQVSDCSSE